MIPIVTVGYNRARSLKRLLNSLNDADYPYGDIELIISIDRADNNQDVLEVAENFRWDHGHKQIVYQKENLKLRRHIIQCGDYSIQYGSVIILEDDLFVSKDFYYFAEAALAFSSKDKRIGGVSLYNHKYNVNCFMPFSALDDKYDNWYFQFASSWGQAWTKEQWLGFRKWYEDHKDEEIVENGIPDAVKKWSSSSWLKYFIRYIVLHNKYFIYPRVSMTTNFGDSGTHVEKNNTDYQVPLSSGKRAFYFSTIEESQSVYDAFFENVKLKQLLNVPEDNVEIDLYKTKRIQNKRFLLSTKMLDYKIIKTWGKEMKPIDANLIYGIDGERIFLYDTANKEKNKVIIRQSTDADYYIRIFKKQIYIELFRRLIREMNYSLKRKVKKLKRQ